MSRESNEGTIISMYTTHVPEVKGGLQEASHVGLAEEVIHGVQVHVSSSGRGANEGVPLPVVILSVQHQIGSDDGHADGYDGNDDED